MNHRTVACIIHCIGDGLSSLIKTGGLAQLDKASRLQTRIWPIGRTRRTICGMTGSRPLSDGGEGQSGASKAPRIQVIKRTQSNTFFDGTAFCMTPIKQRFWPEATAGDGWTGVFSFPAAPRKRQRLSHARKAETVVTFGKAKNLRNLLGIIVWQIRSAWPAALAITWPGWNARVGRMRRRSPRP